jgi:hypothetical protein
MGKINIIDLTQANEAIPRPMYNKPTEAQLLDAAKQAVGSLCDISADDVAVNEHGVIDFATTDSSAVVYFWVDAGDDVEPASYRFQATLLRNVTESPLVYELINAINVDLVYGQLCFREEEITLYYRHMVATSEPDVLAWILSQLLEEADRADDAIQSRVGGERWIERASDEIDV